MTKLCAFFPINIIEYVSISESRVRMPSVSVSFPNNRTVSDRLSLSLPLSLFLILSLTPNHFLSISNVTGDLILIQEWYKNCIYIIKSECANKISMLQTVNKKLLQILLFFSLILVAVDTWLFCVWSW